MDRQNLFDNYWFRFSLFIMLIGIVVLFFSCVDRKPIVIGFCAQLTGRQAELGVQERNGIQLAVETLNASGGIMGHQIDLMIRDDFGIPEKAKAADLDLIDAGVVAIIGHATTGQTVAGLEVTGPSKVVMLSPTVSTPTLSNRDDYFFRVYPSFKKSAEVFAQYIYDNDMVRRLAVIYDRDNGAYAKTYGTTFSDQFKLMGGTIVNQVDFSSTAQPNFTSILSPLRDKKADGLLIVASDIDTALIAQRVRLMGWNIPLYTSAWAQTETLIYNGGQAVEGMKIEQSYGLTSQSPNFDDFEKRYEERFGNTPSFGAAFSYEATMVLAGALEQTNGKSKGLKDALTQVKNFKGLMDTFSFNQYGDVERPFYLSSIRHGKFIILDKLTSN